MEKPLPRDHVGKTHSEILEIEKATWKAWVDKEEHGASEEQKRQFGMLMDITVAQTSDIPASVIAEQPAWRLPIPVAVRFALPAAGAVEFANNPKPLAPRPRLAYGALTYNKSMCAARQYARELEAHEEVEMSTVVLAEIKKEDKVLTKSIVKGNVEWWLGIAQEGVAEMTRGEGANVKFELQWMHPDYPRNSGKHGELVSANDLNQVYSAWFHPREGNKGPKNRKVLEDVDRLSVVMIGIHVTNAGKISVRDKKGISELRVGFVYNGQNLVYKRPRNEIIGV